MTTIKELVAMGAALNKNIQYFSEQVAKLELRGPNAAKAGERLRDMYSPERAAAAGAELRKSMLAVCELAQPERKTMDTKKEAREKAFKVALHAMAGPEDPDCDNYAATVVHKVKENLFETLHQEFRYAPEKPIPAEGVLVYIINEYGQRVYRESTGNSVGGGLKVKAEGNGSAVHIFNDWHEVSTGGELIPVLYGNTTICHKCKNLEEPAYHKVCQECQSTTPTNYKKR